MGEEWVWLRIFNNYVRLLNVCWLVVIRGTQIAIAAMLVDLWLTFFLYLCGINIFNMATIRKYLSTKVVNGVAEIFFRLSVARGKVYKLKSGVFVKPGRFKDGEISYPRANQKEIAELRVIANKVAELEGLVLDGVMGAVNIDRYVVEEIIDKYHHPDKYVDADTSTRSFFDLWDEFLRTRDLSQNRSDIYRSLARCLHRYEMHRKETRQPDFFLDVDALTADDLSDFERFYRDEWKLYDKFPEIYTMYPAELRPQHKTHKPQRRGDNIVVNMMRKIRVFCNWCYMQGLTDNRPFDKYQGNKAERYGTPYYLTKDERDKIADFDLSNRPKLAVQRDIFIFQCLIGCRVSDLVRLQKSNIVGDMIEYVAQKTKKDRSDVVRVPLSKRAKMLIERYRDEAGDVLFPFISSQRYNDAIKEVCKLCGIDRIVTVINPTTGEDERRPIYEVASSHLARRTFIGNLYKQVKDPNLVSSLSGHKEGSKAFARYRDIDDDIKRGLIDLLE